MERKRTKPKGGRVTRNVSLSPAEDRWAITQAELHHGGNVSRYVQTLILRDRDRLEQAQRERAQLEQVA